MKLLFALKQWLICGWRVRQPQILYPQSSKKLTVTTSLLVSCCLGVGMPLSDLLAQHSVQAQLSSSVLQVSQYRPMRRDQRLINWQRHSQSSQRQGTRITLAAASLRQPCILKVETSGGQVTGNVMLDGEIIQRLTGRVNQIDLAPHLTRGENTVEVAMTYSPVSAAVRVEFAAPGTTVSQQSSGNNGSFRYVLGIAVP